MNIHTHTPLWVVGFFFNVYLGCITTHIWLQWVAQPLPGASKGCVITHLQCPCSCSHEMGCFYHSSALIPLQQDQWVAAFFACLCHQDFHSNLQHRLAFDPATTMSLFLMISKTEQGEPPMSQNRQSSPISVRLVDHSIQCCQTLKTHVLLAASLGQSGTSKYSVHVPSNRSIGWMICWHGKDLDASEISERRP